MLNKIKKTQKLFLLWQNYLKNDKAESKKDFYTWIMTTFLGKSLYDMELPWLSFNAQRYLQSIVLPGMKIFEWGSGSSTLFWCKNNCQVVSIEHDSSFYSFLQKKLNSKGYLIDYRLIPPEEKVLQFSQTMYMSNSSGFEGKTFYTYIKEIDKFPDDYFDLVMIDGRARMGCFRKAINKIKIGGTIIFDNSDLDEYASLDEKILRNCRKIVQTGPTPSNIYPVISSTSFITKNAV